MEEAREVKDKTRDTHYLHIHYHIIYTDYVLKYKFKITCPDGVIGASPDQNKNSHHLV